VTELLGTFEQVVLLSVLKLADEAYGRAILRAVQSALDREVAAGAIYATLDRLEQKGLISSELQEGTLARGGRARRYYQVTTKAVQALNQTKTTLQEMWRGAKWPVVNQS
jgi:DNA-binding PadR family transcriptional regulator